MFADLDYSSIESISARLVEASDDIAKIYGAVARARQVREYDSDRRKRVLSVAMKDMLKEGMSAAAAEHTARASESYGEMMKQLGKDLLAAEGIIAEYEAIKLRWETARSLLSCHKTIAGQL